MSNKLPTELGALSTRRSLLGSNNLGLVWDNSGTALKQIPASWLMDYGSPRVVNLLDFGAKGDGTSGVSGAAFASAVSALTSGDLLLIPPGNYDLTDHTTGYTLALANINILGIGKPRLNFGNQIGFALSGTIDQFTVEGVWFDNVKGVLFTKQAITQDVRRVRFVNNRVTNVAATSTNPAGVLDLRCLLQDVKIAGNFVSGVTGAADCFGFLLDNLDNIATRGGGTNRYAWNRDVGAGGTDYEDAIRVHDNSIRNVTSTGASATINTVVSAITAYGWRTIISDNVIAGVGLPAVAGTYTAVVNADGIRVGGFESHVHDNQLLDAGTTAMIHVPTTATGDLTAPGRHRIHHNTLRSKDATTLISGILIEAAACEVSSNTLVDVYVQGTGLNGSGYLINIPGAFTYSVVKDNEFIRGRYIVAIFGYTSTGSQYRRNSAVDPGGPVADIGDSCGLLQLYGTGSASLIRGCRVEDNDLQVGTYFAANFSTWANPLSCVTLTDGAAAWSGLRIKRNSLQNPTAVTLTGGGYYAVVDLQNSVNVAHDGVQILDNYHDATPGLSTMYPVNVATVSYLPTFTNLRIESRAKGPVSLAANTTIPIGWSGHDILVTAAATMTLPGALASGGVTYTFHNTSGGTLRLFPQTGEFIGTGTASQGLNLTTKGSVTIKALAAGLWVIVSSAGTVTYS